MMQLRLAELEMKCKKLGLGVMPSGKRPAKKDYVSALRAHFLPPQGLPYTELEPALCFAEWNLKDDERKKVWESPSWVAQRKYNGCRAIVHFVKGVGVFSHSRTVSVKTFRFQELSRQFLFRDYIPNFSATLDCEVLVDKSIDTREYTAKGEITQSSLASSVSLLHLEADNSIKLQLDQDAALQLFVFDILMDKGQDLRQKRYSERLKILEAFEANIQPEVALQDFQFPKVHQDKKAFFKQVMSEEGEGVILKNLNAPYVDSSSRRRDVWIKVKKRIEMDAFVTGFNRGKEESAWHNLVGDLEFSINTDSGQHIVAYCTNMPLATRRKISSYDAENDIVSLNPKVIGRVAEVSGQDISARSLRLTHSTIERWRKSDGPDGKSPDECFIEMEFLRKSAAWVGT